MLLVMKLLACTLVDWARRPSLFTARVCQQQILRATTQWLVIAGAGLPPWPGLHGHHGGDPGGVCPRAGVRAAGVRRRWGRAGGVRRGPTRS